MIDIRWKQRFQNFEKAYDNFRLVLESFNQNPNSLVHKMAIIQAYEMVFELGWKTIKDYLYSQGIETNFPREAIKEAFAYEVIADGEIWIKMLEDRNLTVHTYDEEKANIVVNEIKENYFSAIAQVFTYFKEKF